MNSEILVLILSLIAIGLIITLSSLQKKYEESKEKAAEYERFKEFIRKTFENESMIMTGVGMGYHTKDVVLILERVKNKLNINKNN